MMLWKTNLVSDGSSNDLRIVLPVMAYTGKNFMGISSGETKKFHVFDDDINFYCWREGVSRNPNYIEYPQYRTTNANPNHIVITSMIRKSDETIIVFISYVNFWWMMSPNTYIEYNKKKYKVKNADGIVLGQKYYKPQYFSLHFPAIPSDADYINISEGKINGWYWMGLKTN